MAFAHGKAADGVAIQVKIRDAAGMFDADIGIGAALVDAEEIILVESTKIIYRLNSVLTPLQPSCGAVDRILHIGARCRVGRAFVEGHGDGRTQSGLDVHTFLRLHKNTPPVYVGGEGDALFRDFTQLAERIYLKPA
jgi:hypothetical protein